MATLNISNLTFKERREKIISHIHNINSIVQSFSTNGVYTPSDKEFDILASVITRLSEAPTWVDETGVFKIAKTLKNVCDIKDTNKCVTLFTVSALGQVRVNYNDAEPTSEMKIRDRRRKIDDIIN